MSTIETGATPRRSSLGDEQPQREHRRSLSDSVTWSISTKSTLPPARKCSTELVYLHGMELVKQATPDMEVIAVGAEDIPLGANEKFILPTPPTPPPPPKPPQARKLQPLLPKQQPNQRSITAADVSGMLAGIPAGVICAFAALNIEGLLTYWGSFREAGAGAIPHLAPGSELLAGMNAVLQAPPRPVGAAPSLLIGTPVRQHSVRERVYSFEQRLSPPAASSISLSGKRRRSDAATQSSTEPKGAPGGATHGAATSCPCGDEINPSPSELPGLVSDASPGLAGAFPTAQYPSNSPLTEDGNIAALTAVEQTPQRASSGSAPAPDPGNAAATSPATVSPPAKRPCQREGSSEPEEMLPAELQSPNSASSGARKRKKRKRAGRTTRGPNQAPDAPATLPAPPQEQGSSVGAVSAPTDSGRRQSSANPSLGDEQSDGWQLVSGSQRSRPAAENTGMGTSAQVPSADALQVDASRPPAASRPPKRPYKIRLSITSDKVLKHGRELGPRTGYKATIAKVTSRIGRPVYEIHTFDRVAYAEAERYARSEKIFCYSHPPPSENSEKLLRVFVRGLPQGYTAENVENELKKLGYALKAVRQICLLKEIVVARNHDSGVANGATGTETRRVEVPTGTFAVTLSDSAASRNIYLLKQIESFAIEVQREKWARPRFCMRCCRWGHIARNCEYDVRCRLCTGEGHPAGDDKRGTAHCPKRGNFNLKPVCCNCKQHHAASFTGCSHCTLPPRPSDARAIGTEGPSRQVVPNRNSAPRSAASGGPAWNEVAQRLGAAPPPQRPTHHPPGRPERGPLHPQLPPKQSLRASS